MSLLRWSGTRAARPAVQKPGLIMDTHQDLLQVGEHGVVSRPPTARPVVSCTHDGQLRITSGVDNLGHTIGYA